MEMSLLRASHSTDWVSLPLHKVTGDTEGCINLGGAVPEVHGS